MTARGDQKAEATHIWHCESNFITCCPTDGLGKEHLLKFYETGYRVDLRRVNGHSFFECRQCQPPTYFFGVLSTSPSPMVTCYALSKESYDEWDKDPSATTHTTQEMLYRLRDPGGRSYNPYWKPPRQ